MSEPDAVVDLPALLARVAALEEAAAGRARLGRRPLPPATPDARLVARVCAATGMTRGRLADAIGLSFDGGSMSKPLSEGSRAKLRDMLREAGERTGKKSDG